MDRRVFIQRGCLACTAAFVAPALLVGCSSARAVVGTVEGEDLVLPAASFTGEDGAVLPYIIATHAQLKQPIALFKQAEGYRAVLMRCTHKGVELRVAGARLECPAHGSIFDSAGGVVEGPASVPLRSFPVTEQEGRLRISLKA